MLATIVIPVWNGIEFLSTCLQSIAAQQVSDALRLEVIAVDNASEDGSADWIAQHHPSLQLIRNRRNEGFAGGCNRGIAAAKGEIIVLLNQDTQLRPDCLSTLFTAFQDPAVGIAGAQIFYPDGIRVQHAGGRLQWPLAFAHHLQSTPWHPIPATHSGALACDIVEFVTGAALAVRRTVLAQIGTLDEGFWPGYFEDVDLCLRARNRGWHVVVVPTATLLHQESSSFSDPVLRATAYQRGRLRLILKHLEPQRFFDEFVPAELDYQPAALWGKESLSLPLAYLSAAKNIAHIWSTAWNADPTIIQRGIASLMRLNLRAWQEEEKKIEALAQKLSATRSVSASVHDATLLPEAILKNGLSEIHFQSDMPFLGTLVAWVRQQIYNLSARWGDQHLRQQQIQVNQHLVTQINILEEQIHWLSIQNQSLYRQMIALRAEEFEAYDEPKAPSASSTLST